MSGRQIDYGPTYKILVLGESGVGKTSIIRRFTDNEYQESYISTIGIDSRTKYIEFGDQKVKLQIWDTAGQERFRTITSAYYRGAMGIMLVYDVTSDPSFSSISNWMESIKQNASQHVCTILVANKNDVDDHMRNVSFKKGKDKAGSCELQFFETSAKNNTNVDDAFMCLANMIKDTKQRVKESSTVFLNGDDDSNRKPRCC